MMRVLLFLSLPFLIFAQTVTIDWYRVNFPPSLIYTPSDASIDNKGYSDKARTIVIENLTNYKHKYLPISIPKVMRLAKKHSTKTVCFAGLNKNKEREEFLLFSEPHLLSLPNQIITRKDNQKIKKFINKDGQVSLSKLLMSDFIVSVAKGRSYSSRIDEIIKKNKSVIKPVSKDISHSYLKQVISKKVDFTIDYPANINYFSSKGIIEDSALLASYPILEENEKIKVYFGCSKKSGNATKIIKDINKIIQNNQKEMTRFYTDYLSDEQRNSY